MSEDRTAAAPSAGAGDPRPKRSLLRRLRDWAAAAVVLCLVLWAALFFLFAPELPNTNDLWRDRPSPGLTVIGADGKVLAKNEIWHTPEGKGIESDGWATP